LLPLYGAGEPRESPPADTEQVYKKSRRDYLERMQRFAARTTTTTTTRIGGPPEVRVR